MLQWGASDPDATYGRLEGSLAFCDLSGFTAMSEKLASLGRLGAEELTEVLNLLFSALLDDAAAYGGGLLKYGGDAVLLFFEGDDHAARAAAATHRMRATLRRLGRVQTSKGVVRVRMSVGVHTGAFDFFLVGDSHRELIVTGVGATTTCDMETAADAGEIMLSPATAAALPASCVGDAKGDGFLLRRAPRTAAREPTAWGVVPDLDPTPFIPVGLRRHIGAVGADAEHRHVAVGFIAFGGVDDLLATHGGPHTATVLYHFISSCQAAFDRYDVCFLYADIYGNGGKVFFTAGAPVTHEDNEERLLRAAREINAGDYPGLHLHTGLNRGYVFAGDVGATFRRTYTIIGDAVNTAARVMASCPVDGQIRAMPEVVDLAASRYAVEEQPPFAAKGKAEPLTTVAVGEPLGPRSADAELPLVGRDVELGEARDALRAAGSGRGGVVRITGEAGIGKSRLVAALSVEAAAQHFAALTTYAERYERSTPYYVLEQLVATLDGATELRRAIADSDGDDAPVRLAKQLVALLDDALEGPALWVIDNGHLVDDASAQVISHAVAELVTRPWLLVVASRDDEPSPFAFAGGTAVELGPLAVDAAADLARLANPQLLPTSARLLAERANGNPLFLRQLIAADMAGAELSDSLEAVVAARIDRLPAAQRDLLRTAAVLGGSFEIDTLRVLVDGPSPDLAAVNEFVSVSDVVAAFRQALYREVAYAGLTFRRRRDLHLAAGRFLEASGEPNPANYARLALHFDRAGAWHESWRYTMRAAAHAMRSSAKVIAAELYERAVFAGRRLGEAVSRNDLARAMAEWARALIIAGRRDEALSVIRAARRVAPANSVEQAMLDLRLGVLSDDGGDTAGAARAFRRGLTALEASGADLTHGDAVDAAVSLVAGLGGCRLRQGRLTEAHALSERATALAEASANGELQSRAYDLSMLVAFSSGDLPAAIRHAERAVAATRSAGPFVGSTAASLMNLAVLKTMAGQWRESEQLLIDALEAHHTVGNDVHAAQSQINLAELYINQGRWSDAAAALDEAEPIAKLTTAEAAAYAALFRARLGARCGKPIAWTPDDTARDVLADEPVAETEAEIALASGDRNTALLLLEDSDGPRTPVLRALLTEDSAALDAIASGDDRCNAVLARSLLGQLLPTDADAEALGIVDVPVWAKP